MIRQTVALFAVTVTTPRGAPPEVAPRRPRRPSPRSARPAPPEPSPWPRTGPRSSWSGSARSPAPADRSATNPGGARTRRCRSAERAGARRGAGRRAQRRPRPVRSAAARCQGARPGRPRDVLGGGRAAVVVHAAGRAVPRVAQDAALADAASVPPPRAAMRGSRGRRPGAVHLGHRERPGAAQAGA